MRSSLNWFTHNRSSLPPEQSIGFLTRAWIQMEIRLEILFGLSGLYCSVKMILIKTLILGFMIIQTGFWPLSSNRTTRSARPLSARLSASGRGGRKVTSFRATSWGCTGRTGSLGNASSWSPASASPRWSWLHPDSRPARWGHTCEKLPSGCDKQRIIRHADSFHSSKKVQAASVAMDWFTRQYLDTQMATLDATKSDWAFNYHGNCIKKWTNITGALTSRRDGVCFFC